MLSQPNAKLCEVVDIDSIKLSDLQRDQRELAEVIGIEAYLKLVKIYGGTTIYIAKMDKLQNIKRDAEIVKNFNGYNYKQLAHKHHLAERTVREIIARANLLNGAIQMSFFDDS